VVADSVVDGKRHVRLRLTSPRGAPVMGVFVPAGAGLESVRLDGEPVPPGGNGKRRPGGAPGTGWRPFTLHTLAPQGTEMEVVLGATQPMDWYLVDQSYELPPSAPLQEGNGTLVSRKVRI
jgi:hypothetical protein